MIVEWVAATLFVFGRTGGNIIPEAVTIDRTGVVEVDGNATGTTVPQTRLRQLVRLARKEHFGTLPTPILCVGVLPDIAAGFITYGGHTVLEHGGCNVRFMTLYNALWRATGTQ